MAGRIEYLENKRKKQGLVSLENYELYLLNQGIIKEKVKK